MRGSRVVAHVTVGIGLGSAALSCCCLADGIGLCRGNAGPRLGS